MWIINIWQRTSLFAAKNGMLQTPATRGCAQPLGLAQTKVGSFWHALNTNANLKGQLRWLKKWHRQVRKTIPPPYFPIMVNGEYMKLCFAESGFRFGPELNQAASKVLFFNVPGCFSKCQVGVWTKSGGLCSPLGWILASNVIFLYSSSSCHHKKSLAC